MRAGCHRPVPVGSESEYAGLPAPNNFIARMKAVASGARLPGAVFRFLSPGSLLIRFLLCWMAVACPFARAAAPATGDGPPFTFSDRLGRTITLSATPQRVVSLAPSNTELAFAVGAGERLVGVTTYCNHPAAAVDLPKIGGFAARTISIEAIVALKPDLVLAGDRNQRAVVDALERAGVTVAAVQPRGWTEIQETMRLLGRIFGTTETADRLIGSANARLQAVAARIGTVPPAQRVRVYWEVFDEPLMSAGPRSLIGEAVTLAGGVNIFADLKEEYPQVSVEAVIARDPQVIIGPASMRQRSMSLEALRARPGWALIAAVRDGRVVILPDEPVTRAGPRFAEGVELVAKALYPALFPDAGEETSP